MSRAIYGMYVTLGTCALGTVAKSLTLVIVATFLTHALSSLMSFQRIQLTVASFQLYISLRLRVRVLSCHAMCISLSCGSYPLTLWLYMHAYRAACSNNTGHVILLNVYFSLSPRFCIIVLQDVLKASIPKNLHEATVEVDLISILQCKVR